MIQKVRDAEIMPNGGAKLLVEVNEMVVASYIVELVAEFTSQHNDGYTKEGTIKKLLVIRDYINRVLTEC